jgi:hypothetical protein
MTDTFYSFFIFNDFCKTYQYVIQLLVAVGTIASVVVSLWLSSARATTKIKGELYLGYRQYGLLAPISRNLKHPFNKYVVVLRVSNISQTNTLEITNPMFVIKTSLFPVYVTGTDLSRDTNNKMINFPKKIYSQSSSFFTQELRFLDYSYQKLSLNFLIKVLLKLGILNLKLEVLSSVGDKFLVNINKEFTRYLLNNKYLKNAL